jgi:hypothetical protein
LISGVKELEHGAIDGFHHLGRRRCFFGKAHHGRIEEKGGARRNLVEKTVDDGDHAEQDEACPRAATEDLLIDDG